MSRSAAATCISCARLAIPVSWSMMAKPPSRGSMPVMRCSLSVQAGGRSVSRRDRSDRTRPLRRFHDRSHGASSAASSWSQLSCTGIGAGSAGAARSPWCAGAMGSGEPVPSGAHRGDRGASSAGMDPCWAAPPAPGAALVASPSPAAWPAAWGGGRRAYGACHRGPPCPPLEDVGGCLLVVHRGCSVHRVPGQVFQHRPGLFSTCLHTGGLSLVLWPLAPGGAAQTYGWCPLALV